MEHHKSDDDPNSTITIGILCACLFVLIVLLIYLYKRLNKEAEGEYTIRRMVYKEGGVRDRVRGAALALGTRVGVRLWPHSDTDGEEMQNIQDEEGRVEGVGSQEGDSQRSDSGGGSQGDGEDCGETMGDGDNTSHDISSSEGSEAGEQTGLMDQTEGNEEEEVVKGGGKGEASGGPGLLKQFSGGAIWSEEEGGEGNCRDVTAL